MKSFGSLLIWIATLIIVIVITILSMSTKYDANRTKTQPYKYKLMWSMMTKKSPVDQKPFAYHLLTECCIPNYLLEPYTLGNSELLDVYVLSFRAECKNPLIPDHVTHIFNTTTTWTTGRNLLYNYVKKKGLRYKYHIYMDDDVELFFSYTYDEFSRKVNIPRQTPGLANRFLQPDIYQKALREERNGKSAWRRFEELLLEESPAYSVITHIQDYGFDSRVQQEARWATLCSENGPMPMVTPSFFVDAVVIAYHEEALPLLMPYNPVGDYISWFLSAVYFIYRTKAILYKQGITTWEICHINYKSRPYPRNRFPPNYLDIYWQTEEGKKIEHLIDVRDRNFIMFYADGGKWRDVFFGDRGVCTKPVKFPVHKHYKINKK